MSKKQGRTECGKFKRKDISFYIDENGCFICTSHFLHQAKPTSKGLYPLAFDNGKHLRMSRYIYNKCIGKIPKGMCVLHECDNPLCINPIHFKLGTYADNAKDMVERGRSNYGTRNPGAKLTELQVKNILMDGTSSHMELASKYGVGRTTIQHIRFGKTWKYLGIKSKFIESRHPELKDGE